MSGFLSRIRRSRSSTRRCTLSTVAPGSSRQCATSTVPRSLSGRARRGCRKALDRARRVFERRDIVCRTAAAISLTSAASGSSGSMWISISACRPNSRRIAASRRSAVACAAQRQRAVELQVERQRQPVAQMLDRDVVHVEALALRDEIDALAHRLVAWRNRHRLHGYVGPGSTSRAASVASASTSATCSMPSERGTSSVASTK